MLTLDELFNKLTTANGKKEILDEFNTIDVSNFRDGDNFFEKYGGGNYTIDRNTLPYAQRDYVGRIDVYLNLFDLLKEKSPDKFYQIHKGTPYCLLGWLFFDIGDYEQGLFYIDAAMSEDRRIDPKNWQDRPATQFLFLKQPSGASPIGIRIVNQIQKFIKQEIEDYQKQLGQTKNASNLLDNFIEKFVKPNIESFTHRTLVSALHIFVLEAHACSNLIKRRSVDRGSIEPFLSHLHKGSLLFESLLKEVYTSHSSSTLGTIFNDPFVQSDLKFKQPNLGKVGQTLDDLVRHVFPYLENNISDKHNQWFTIVIRLRNITSHSLLWPDVFNEEIYKKLYQQILFASFWVIEKKF